MNNSTEIIKRTERIKSISAQLIAELEQIQLDAERISSGHVCHLPEIKIIQESVAAHFGLSPQVMVSATRTDPFVNARSLAIFLCRRITFYTTMEIGQCFGGREHSSVLYSFTRTADKMDGNPAFLKDVQELERSCRERIQQSGNRISLIKQAS